MEAMSDRDAILSALLARAHAAELRASSAEADTRLARDMLDQEIGRTGAAQRQLETERRVTRRLRALLSEVLAAAEQGVPVPRSIVDAAVNEIAPAEWREEVA